MRGYLGCEAKKFGIVTFTKCDECHYRYDEDVCRGLRRDQDVKLGYIIYG